MGIQVPAPPSRCNQAVAGVAAGATDLAVLSSYVPITAQTSQGPCLLRLRLVRPLVLLVALTALTATSTCMRQPGAAQRTVTGTCQGACDLYLSCKRDDDEQRWTACMNECNDFFASEQALREFERMECEDVISFVEGPNGRAPGSKL
jgi:hypothetical protein